MTTQKINKGNKLIHKFIKAKYEKVNLQYHCSWNDIMPIIKDIENLHCNVGIFTGMNNESHCMIVHFNELGRSIWDTNKSNESKILAIWLAIVEFIEYYNNNLKTKNTYIKCFDKFDVELKEGDIVDVQMDGEHKIYKKEDGQLYFKPYGKEDRVCAYFRNDMVKVED
jgi:hypothetical protein